MNLLRRVVAGTAIAAVTMLPLADFASAGNKGDGNFCPGRENSCPSGGGGNGGNGDDDTTNNNNNNSGNQMECLNSNPENIIFIGGIQTCVQDVIDVTNKVKVIVKK